jgi:anti-sigma B factor antagonist
MSAFDVGGSWETVVMDYLRVEVERRNGRAAVRAVGELDLASVGELGDAIDRAGTARAVVLDLAGITYFDASGVRLLRRAHDEASARGSSFRVRRASPIVRTVLELVDELDLLDDDDQYAK